MPHYTTWGGTYVTRPVAREDRSPIQSDGDFNDVVFHSKQADSFMKLDDIRGEFTTGGGGDSFNSWRDVRDHNYGKVINGPLYQPEADGLIQRGDIYQDKAQLMQHAPKESEYRPEAQVNPVGVGYTEVEWTYFADNIGGTAGPGGSTFTTCLLYTSDAADE